MGYAKKAAPYLRPVLQRMLFIGFSIQIVLGICWMCCNFGQVQGFGEPESALYGGILRLFGGVPAVVYSLQLAAAFFAGALFLQKLRPAGLWLALWRGLALVTSPFAMQCHLSLQPYSLMGTAFLLFLLALTTLLKKGGAVPALAALGCAVLSVALSGAFDGDRREMPGYNLEAALASRFAWPTLWTDYDWYEEDLAEILRPVVWEASMSPDNMRLLQERLESQAGAEGAKAYSLRIARRGWEGHAPGVVRQIAWDVLGYAAAPLVFPLQMEGRGYDSYSGRNYEVMRERSPVLTRDYVDYGCWWFGWMLAVSFFLLPFRGPGEEGSLEERKRRRKKAFACAGAWVLACGVLVAALTMRGAGMMDYRETIGVAALWMMGPLLLLDREWLGTARRKGI